MLERAAGLLHKAFCQGGLGEPEAAQLEQWRLLRAASHITRAGIRKRRRATEERDQERERERVSE